MAENFVNILREIRGKTLAPATDKNCIYGDIKWMYGVISGYQQITPAERLKIKNIEEGATKNSTDAFLLSRANHTGNMSIANVQDTPSRMAMTIHEKNKLEAIPQNATANDTDANLRNRATHTGTQSIDTITDTSTHVKMSVAERDKLYGIATGATKNATDAELRSRSTHTGTQSADSIVDGLVNAAYTLQEKNKLSVLSTTVPPAHTHDNTSIMSLSYSKLTGVPETFYPSEHLHSMNEITTGNLDATRINQTNSMQFVNSIEKEKIAISETTNNKGTPFGYAPLDGNGKINPSYLDSLNVIDVFTPINQEAMLLLTSAKPGDIAYVQNSQNTYMLVALPVHIQENWKQMNSGSGVITFNGLNGVVNVGTDEIPEGSANVYFTNERVDDRVANLLTAGENVSIAYNDDTNQIIISANDTYTEWSEIQNKPNTKIDVNLSGDISGSGSVTLSQLGNGALNIPNMTLNSVGTAGTYAKVTTNTKGQVVAGTALSAGDIPSLDASKITSGIIDIDRLPASACSIPEYAKLSEFPLVGDSGKVYIALDTNKMYRWSGSTYVSIAGGVDSVAGKTGVVSLAKGDVELANVDNTSDINKPISTATQTALNTKVDITRNQTVEGVKTFTSSPIVPTPTAVNHAANKDYVDTNIGLLSTDFYQGAYGISWDYATDTYIRTGAKGYTAIQSLMRRCVLNADGTVNYYLNPNNSNFKEDGTPSILTGADGNVMVEIPKHYIKVETVGNIDSFSVSLTPEVGYVLDPAFLKWNGTKMVEVHYRYFRAYEGFVSGGKLLSVSGVTPTRSQTIATFRTQAIANGAGWHLTDWNLLNTIKRLCYIEFCDFIVTKYLGEGNHTGSDYGITTGQSNALGNISSNSTHNDKYMSYRGIENLYADIWEFVDGVNVNNYQFYVNGNYSSFASDVFAGSYVAKGPLVAAGASNSLIKRCAVSSDSGFIPTVVGGSTTTFYGDALWSATGARVILYGGDAAGDASGGLGALIAVTASSLSDVHLGAAVCR